jgi:hypothetical protein
MRGLLARAGAVLDAALPVDTRALHATGVAPDSGIGRLASRFADGCGLARVELVVSPKLGATCIPVSASPPVVLMGSPLLANELVAAFLMARAFKLVSARACALARTAPSELGVFVAAWLRCFNPAWEPQGIAPTALQAAASRMQANLPRSLEPDVGVMATEVGGRLGTRSPDLGASALAWGDRVALLAVGDLRAAVDAIAMSLGHTEGAPAVGADRVAWIVQTPEALDLVVFAVSDAFLEARMHLGIDV